MKVKKFNNLWTMGIILSMAILVIIYIVKLFFPNIIVEVAQIENIVKLGHYIDSNKWAWYVASFIISFFVYYLCCCASCEKKKLTLSECLIICATIIGLFLIREFLPNQYNAFNIVSQIFLPFLFKAKFKNTVIIFALVHILQSITLEIRGLMMYIADFNFASLFILMIDYYIFEVLLYFLFNYKKGE